MKERCSQRKSVLVICRHIFFYLEYCMILYDALTNTFQMGNFFSNSHKNSDSERLKFFFVLDWSLYISSWLLPLKLFFPIFPPRPSSICRIKLLSIANGKFEMQFTSYTVNSLQSFNLSLDTGGATFCSFKTSSNTTTCASPGHGRWHVKCNTLSCSRSF
jgi:hypothetical protein